MDKAALRRLTRFGGLAGTERWHFLRAFAALAAVDMGLRLVGFHRLVQAAQLLDRAGRRPLRPEDMLRAREYACWIGTASRHHNVGMHCLHRSLALHYWLRHAGLPSELRIGVRKEHGELRAHAWVELGGQPLDEQPSAISGFTPLASADGRPPPWDDGDIAPVVLASAPPAPPAGIVAERMA